MFLPSPVAVSAGAVPPGKGTQAGPQSASLAQPFNASGGRDWGGYGRICSEQHCSPLTDLAWFMDLQPSNSATQLPPVGGVLILQIIPQVAEQSDSELADVRHSIGDEARAWRQTVMSGQV